MAASKRATAESYLAWLKNLQPCSLVAAAEGGTGPTFPPPPPQPARRIMGSRMSAMGAHARAPELEVRVI
jgi:hypothetical protein